MGTAAPPAPPPDLPLALCRRYPAIDWTSDDREHQQAAKLICQRCPELAPCHEWAMSLSPWTAQAGIVAGMTAYQRTRRLKAERRQARQQAAETAELAALALDHPMAAANKARTHCGICGRELAGDNLVVTLHRGGREHRDCRYCRRKRNAASNRLARALRKARA